jgi:hypothetical protein
MQLDMSMFWGGWLLPFPYFISISRPDEDFIDGWLVSRFWAGFGLISCSGLIPLVRGFGLVFCSGLRL